ncbi:MAG: helix-turn-helix domain-containing protein [Candidatus Magasanikbacteria bacterium]
MIEQLKNLGLEESEVQVYLALLELGPSNVSEITKKAGVTRTLGYHVLEKLGWYGLVDQTSSKGKKKIYSAQHPHRLLQFVKNKKNVWDRKVKDIESYLPNLVSLYKIADKPTVRYQMGDEGLKNIYIENLESKTEILSILDVDGWDVPEFRQFGKWYIRERVKRKIPERILMLERESVHEYYNDPSKLTDYKWIKFSQLPGILDLGGEINIFENKVLIAITKKPNRMGILIESEVLANLIRAMFELAWQVGIPADRKRKKVLRKTK